MYDLEVIIRRRPLHVSDVAAEALVQEIIESVLAAWGIPFPYRVSGASDHAFVDQLAETGEYRHAEAGYSIVVKRTV